jgi:uncharacterized protein YeaO (DUF488 family)
VRRPPRGVPKSDFAKRDFYDVWLPELSPSGVVVTSAMSEAMTPARWKTFSRTYLKEMSASAPRHLIETLAALSKDVNFSVGCYCEDESNCHRSLLRELLVAAGAKVTL